MPSQAKACGQYINSVLAAREAHARGFDEALLLNSAGVLAVGSGENIFVVKNGIIATNGLSGDPNIQASPSRHPGQRRNGGFDLCQHVRRGPRKAIETLGGRIVTFDLEGNNQP